MAVEEVGIRLSLTQRREVAKGLQDTQADLQDVADAGEKVDKAGQDAARSLGKASSRTFARGFSAIGGGVKSLAGFLGRGLVRAGKAAAVGIGVLAVAAAGLSVKAISLASDARETGSAFDTVFGGKAKKVGGELDKLSKKFGLYGPDLQDAARQFGVFAKAADLPKKNLAGFSTDLTKAGLDLSSFYNVDPGQAFQALQSGLSGEAEPLRKFGIFLSDTTLKAKAASMGLTGELTEQQKVMLRQKIIMSSLGDAQGDLARTSEGFANQQRGAQGRMKQFLTTLGGPLTTAATGAFRGLNSFLGPALGQLERRIPGLERTAQGLSKRFAAFGKDAGKGLPGFLKDAGEQAGRFRNKAAGVIDKARSLKDQFDGLSAGKTGTQFREAGAGLSVIGGALKNVDLTQLAEGFSSGVNDTVSVFGVVIGFAADHVDTLGKYMPYLIGAFIAYKAAQTAANVAAIRALPVTVAQTAGNFLLASANRRLATQMAITNGVEQVGIITRIRGTVATVASSVASKVAGAATKVWAAGQWLLNAALTANPIGLVVAGIALLVGGLIIAYKKSDTFRAIIDTAFGLLKRFGSWLGGKLIGFLLIVGSGFIRMGRFGIKAFTWLLKAAFKAFDGILSAAERGLGWVPGLGDKIRGARERFNEFGNSTIGKLNELGGRLKTTQDKIDGIARDRSATITVTTVEATARVNLARDRPRREHGGPVQAGNSYIVGERRPELFVPTVGGRIIPKVPEIKEMSDSTGQRRPRDPIVVQVQVDRKTIAECVVGELEAKGARR